MTEILLNTIERKPISFVGELVSQAEGNVVFADQFNRKFEMKLYAITSGGYVPVIEYQSDNPAERSGCIAEIVDLVKDIENFFYVFIPDELVPEVNGLTREMIELRKKLLNTLRKSYESLTFTFLEQIEAIVGRSENADAPAYDRSRNE